MSTSGFRKSIITLKVKADRLIPVDGEHDVNLSFPSNAIILLNDSYVDYPNNSRDFQFNHDNYNTFKNIKIRLNSPGKHKLKTKISSEYFKDKTKRKIQEDFIEITVYDDLVEGWTGTIHSVFGVFSVAGDEEIWTGDLTYFHGDTGGNYVRIHKTVVSNAINAGSGYGPGAMKIRVTKPDGTVEIKVGNGSNNVDYLCDLRGHYTFEVAAPFFVSSKFFASGITEATYTFSQGTSNPLDTFTPLSTTGAIKHIGVLTPFGAPETVGASAPVTGHSQSFSPIEINEGNNNIASVGWTTNTPFHCTVTAISYSGSDATLTYDASTNPWSVNVFTKFTLNGKDMNYAGALSFILGHA